jgi:hypothetical protein
VYSCDGKRANVSDCALPAEPNLATLRFHGSLIFHNWGKITASGIATYRTEENR